MEHAFKDNSGTEDLISIGGTTGVNVPTGAATTTIKVGQGRLARVTVLVAGTGAGNVVFTDGTGQVVAAIPATIGVPLTGALIFDVPFYQGLSVTNVLNGPQLYVVV